MSKTPGTIALRQVLGILAWTAGVMTLAAAVFTRDSQWLMTPAIALLLAGLIEAEF
jgi:hypothetical protein